jgi:hypothetical protein
MIRRGFTLMEVLVASVSFLVILTGLAAFLQASMLTSRTATEMNNCMLHYKSGVRALAYGDPAGNHAGLTAASGAWIWYFFPGTCATAPGLTIATWASYEAENASYQIWLDNGQLFRNREGMATQTLMGEAPPNPGSSTNRIVVFSRSEHWEVRPYNGAAKALLVFPVTLFQDTDRNNLIGEEETTFSGVPKMFLRNSER